MGSVGFPELIVIFLVALIVLGPDKLPAAAKQMGRAYAEFKKVTTHFQDEIRGALDLDGATASSAPAPSASPPQPGPAPSEAVEDIPPPRD